MIEGLKTYTGNELYQLLLKGSDARSVVNDWVERNVQSDLRIRRAKTRGCVVIETRDVVFANNITIWYPDAKVAIKECAIHLK